MADISGDSILPSGEFKATLCSATQIIAAGSSGTLQTLTPTGGRKIRLTMLSVGPGASESGISVVADGVTVISSKTLTGTLLGLNAFTIGFGQDASGNPLTGNTSHIEAFTSIVISKASGSTASNIYYATEQGF